MTQRVQELFLANADFVPQRGIPALLERLKPAVGRTLGPISLRQTLSARQVVGLITNLHKGEEITVFGSCIQKLETPVFGGLKPERVGKFARA